MYDKKKENFNRLTVFVLPAAILISYSEQTRLSLYVYVKLCTHKTSQMKIAKIAWVVANSLRSSFIYEHRNHHQQQEQRQPLYLRKCTFCMVYFIE